MHKNYLLITKHDGGFWCSTEEELSKEAGYFHESEIEFCGKVKVVKEIQGGRLLYVNSD